MVKPSDLHTIWAAPDNSRLTPTQYSFRLPVHVAAKLAALGTSIRVGRVPNWWGTSSPPPSMPSRKHCPVNRGTSCSNCLTAKRNSEMEGMRRRFRDRANRHYHELETELGDDEPGRPVLADARDAVRIHLPPARHDTLQCAYYLRREPDAPFDFEALLAQREALRSSSSRDPAVVMLGDAEFLLHRYGSSSGYPLVLTCPEYTIECGEFNRPSFFVTYRSEALWRESAAGLQARFLTWAQGAGLAAYRPESVGRVDWALDYHLPTVDFDESHFVSLAAKDSKHREGGRIQTLTFGRGDVVLRVYDKVAEIEQQSHKTWLYPLWGGVCEDVWRIEWQVRKALLRQFGIRTLQSLFERQGDVLRYLVTEHTTLRVPTADSNRSRWPLHPLWQDLQRRIAEFDSLGRSVRTARMLLLRSVLRGRCSAYTAT